MNTTYYALKQPAVRVEPWLLGAGNSVYDKDDHLLASLHTTCLHWIADRGTPVADRYGGSITVYATGPDDQQAISERGELVTLGQLRRGEAP